MVAISVNAGIGAGLDISRNGISGNINGGAGFNIGRSNPTNQNSYRLVSVPTYQSPHTVNYPSADTWNHSARGNQHYNYTNTNSTPSVYIVQADQPDKPYIDNKAGNNEKVWNAALATLNSLANISSKGTGTQSAIDNLAHSSRTLIDSLKESGALTSSGQEQRGYSSACNSHTHSNISPSNCYSPNTSAVSRLIISPNGNQLSVNGSNRFNNSGLSLVSNNNNYHDQPTYYNQSSSTSTNYNDIQISQGENGSVIINLPAHYNDTQPVAQNPSDNNYQKRLAYYNQSSSTSTNYNDIQISEGENGSVIINLPPNTISI